MPIEDLQITKAPPKWQPSSDQRQQVERDSRLQRLSRDELYYFFNKPRTPSTGKGAGSGRTTPPARGQKSSGGIFGWVDSVTNALKGGK